MGLNEGVTALFISTGQNNATDACNESDPTSAKVYGAYSSSTVYAVGSYLHITDESAVMNGTGAANTNYTQTSVFAGSNLYYKARIGFYSGSAYVTSSSSNRYAIQIDNDGKIISSALCS
tara:strand:+ start:192 stop:551 length:360 start_codon:yes stop_codon:yes gene_type:complete